MMTQPSSKLSTFSESVTPNRVWLVIFGLWALFLSGVLNGFGGSPGIVQAIRLKSLLAAKDGQVKQIETEIQRLEHEASLLEKNRVIQHREIRKVLGYAAANEIIFDFSSANDPSI